MASASPMYLRARVSKCLSLICQHPCDQERWQIDERTCLLTCCADARFPLLSGPANVCQCAFELTLTRISPSSRQRNVSSRKDIAMLPCPPNVSSCDLNFADVIAVFTDRRGAVPGCLSPCKQILRSLGFTGVSSRGAFRNDIRGKPMV